MSNLAGFREAVEQYRKRVGRTEEELARELYISKGELNKRLRNYSHPQSKRTWRLQSGHVKAIVETLAKWGAITARKQAFALFTLSDFPALAEEIDWQAAPWNKLHVNASPTEPSLSLSVPVRRRLFQARDMPKDYVPRPNAFDAMKHLLLAPEQNQTTAITTAFRGAGGFGKTTLASALCYDRQIQEAFPDGILWVELGEHPPRPLDVLNELLHVLEPSVAGALTLEEARQRWQSALENRACLLVIDDVWHTEALEELLQGGPRCRRLVTTRNDQLLPEDTKRVWVDAMEPAEAMALLCEGVIDEWPNTLDPSVLERVVVQQLGCWPLLVSLARGMLKNQVERLHKAPKQALAQIKHGYDERGMATFHLGDRDERQRNVDACVEVNLRQLEEWVPAHYQARQRYLELAVFPEDTPIPLSTLQIYWKGTGGLRDWEVEDLCLRLADFSLLLPWNTEQPTIRLHDVLRTYLIQQAGNQVPSLHQRLLDAHHQHYELTRWADLPQSEMYLWQFLGSHLRQVGNVEVLHTTLTDILFVTRKAVYMGVSALEADLALAMASSQNESGGHPSSLVTSLHQTITQISHLLRQVSSEAEVGSLLLSHLHDDVGWDCQRQILNQELPRPFFSVWHSLPHISSPALIRTLRGHTGAVTACGYSPDGKWIVSASYDHTLKVWDSTTGAEQLTLIGHTSIVLACGFSPDSNQIVSASHDRTLKIWDSTTGAEVRTLRGHTGPVSACRFSPDGKWIVSASHDHTLKVWEAATGVEMFTLTGHTKWVTACGCSPDGTKIVSASMDHTLKVWNASTGEECRTLTGHTSWIWACGFSPNGKWIISASADKTLRVWDSTTGAEVRTLRGHSWSVNACEYSPDGKWIISASSDHTLKVWDSTTGVEVRTLTGHTGKVTACEYSPDGKWIVSASSKDDTLKVWDSTTGAEVRTLFSHIGPVSACGFSSDGRFIVSASEGQTLKVWDSTTGAEVRTLFSHIGPVSACGFSSDDKWIVSASSEDDTLKVWDSTTGAEVRTLRGHSWSVNACEYSPDGKWIISASSDHTLKVWDSTTGVEVRTLTGHTDEVTACEYSPDGKWIVSASY